MGQRAMSHFLGVVVVVVAASKLDRRWPKLLTTSEIPDICFKISSKAAGLLLIALPLLLESRLLVLERRRLLCLWRLTERSSELCLLRDLDRFLELITASYRRVKTNINGIKKAKFYSENLPWTWLIHTFEKSRNMMRGAPPHGAQQGLFPRFFLVSSLLCLAYCGSFTLWEASYHLYSIHFDRKVWSIIGRQALLLNGKCWCRIYIFPVQRKQVTRGFIFVLFISNYEYCYKSIFKLNIKGNSHIVQDERKQISCESPLGDA
jgi:hypothetical protein